ncbi:MAG: DUF4158 domain-containing protein, partial [Deltaproteobacteria bacterium]|nr:DUF4158 domain-containing protein [Deltaproteobacteria bacterium]
MNNNQKRLTILTQSEIQDYFGIPRFILEERECYFTLSDNDIGTIQESWSIHSKVNFILMFGYFKSRRMFFNYKWEDVSTDIAYILTKYFPEYSVTRIKISGKTTKIQQQKL